jgi:putative ABC transport system ATP-binding protein
VVFQSGNLIPFLSALENVQLAARLAGGNGSGSRAAELLGEVGLGGRLHHLPRQLSGGETQRVAIAVALANDPDLLLADELTGELDSVTAGQVMGVVRTAWEQRRLTTLVVTHNRELAAEAHHQLSLVDGVVRAV